MVSLSPSSLLRGSSLPDARPASRSSGPEAGIQGLTYSGGCQPPRWALPLSSSCIYLAFTRAACASARRRRGCRRRPSEPSPDDTCLVSPEAAEQGKGSLLVSVQDL